MNEFFSGTKKIISVKIKELLVIKDFLNQKSRLVVITIPINLKTDLLLKQ